MDVQVAACFELTLCCQASKACKGSTEAFRPRHTTGLYSWPRGRQPYQAGCYPTAEEAHAAWKSVEEEKQRAAGNSRG
jgi:hypothetical protein